MFYKTFSEKTLAFKVDKYVRGKKAEQRLTVLIAANMTVFQKLPLFFIGKYLKPK